MSSIKKITIAIGVIALFVTCSYFVGLKDGINKATSASVEEVDTLVIRDTIVSEKPIYITRTRIDSIPYPVIIHITDTIWKTDTVWLDREQVIWQDSLSRVYASGVSVEIDSVAHFLTTQYVIKKENVIVKERSRWGIGIQAGYGACVKDSQVLTSPYIGIGLSYNIFTW